MYTRCFHRSFIDSHLNANDRLFLSFRIAPEPLEHAPPAFLFLSSTMSISGKSLFTLQSTIQTETCTGSLSGGTGSFSPASSGIRKRSAAPGGTASLSDRAYMRGPLPLSSTSLQIFCICKNLLISHSFTGSCRSVDNFEAMPLCGFFVQSEENSPDFGHRRRLTFTKRVAAMVNETETLNWESGIVPFFLQELQPPCALYRGKWSKQCTVHLSARLTYGA
jgi:hypothetical protein